MNKDTNLIYGKNPVYEALNAKKALKVFMVANFNDQRITNLVREYKIPVVTVSPNEMDKMSNNGVHQGVAAELKPYQTVSLDEIILKAKKKDKKIFNTVKNFR